MEGLGETRDALQISAFTVLLNIVLNGPFIKRFGVAGAAHATSMLRAAQEAEARSKEREESANASAATEQVQAKRLAAVESEILDAENANENVAATSISDAGT